MSVTRFDVPGHARSLTFSCYHRLPLLGDPITRDVFAEHIEVQRERLGFGVVAWIIMPEHVHIIVVPRDGRLGPVLRGLKQGFAQRMLRRWREHDAPVLRKLRDSTGGFRFWQRGGGHDRNLRDTQELREKVLYIHANPVRRGLVTRELDWAWSSAPGYAGLPTQIALERRWTGRLS